MNFAEKSYGIFEQSVADYHIDDDVDAATRQPYAPESIEGILYAKNRIDAVQWHLEDIIRDPDIDPVEALALKRRIDRSNQERTDMVEELDSYFRTLYSGVEVAADATINTESPAWALDRLSILALKIYHMVAEAGRADAYSRSKSTIWRQRQAEPTLRRSIVPAARPSSRFLKSRGQTSCRQSAPCSTISPPGASI